MTYTDEMTVQYASARPEIMRAYWGAWKAGLWKTNLILCLLVGIFGSKIFGLTAQPSAASALRVMLLALSPQLINFAMPLILFKPQTRTLTIDRGGWHSQIGNKSGSIPWQEVRNVELVDTSVILSGNNGNALIVPSRAFANIAELQHFYHFAKAMHQAASCT